MIGVPDELLAQILSYVGAQSDFLSLSRVSKRLNNAALPYLYSRFTHELYKDPERLHQFLRNIICEPELAGYVEAVDLKDQQKCGLFNNLHTWRVWAEKSYRPRLSEEDKEVFHNAVLEMGLQSIDAPSTIAVKEEAQVALMLSRATNLTDLRMTLPDLSNNRLLLDILRETTARGTALQNLRKFTGIYYNFDGSVEGGFELRPISCLFSLPNIETVNGIACLEPEDAAFRNFDCPEGTSSVEHIEFRRSSICPKAMGLMVGACRALKSFYCDWGGHTVGWSEINFPTVGTALRKQEHSLEKLTLDVRKHYDVWPEQEDVLIPPLGSFSGCQHLTHIEAPAAALIGWDEGRVDGFPMLHEVLPYSLETLIVNQWSPGIIEHLEKMSELCATMFPNLKSITLHSALHADQESEEKMQTQFTKAGSEVAINFIDSGEVDHFS